MHKCVRCGSIYEDNDSNILRGCTGCGGIFFLYIKGEADARQLDAMQRELQERDTTLEKELVKQIEKRRSKKRAEEKVKKKIKKKVKAKVKKKIRKKLRKKVGKKKPRKEKLIKKKIRKERVEKEKVEKPEKRIRKEVIKIGKEKFAVEDIFGIETVRVPKDGVYEINIDALMKKRPVIVLERGHVYFIHLPLLFEELSEMK